MKKQSRQGTTAPSHARRYLEQRLRCWPLLAGVLAFIVYLLTLSRGAYPGLSATLVTSAAQLIPESLPDHPCWTLMVRAIAHCPVQELPLRLNLFSAICGATAVALFGLLVSRFLFAAAYDDASDNKQALPPEDTHTVARVNPAVNAYNRRAAFAALLGGWAAALALAFSVPFWSAATRLQYQTFDMLLMLIILHLVMLYRTTFNATLRHALALAVAVLCGAGCVESAIFIPLAAVLFFLLPVYLIQRKRAWEYMLLYACMAAVAGACLNLLALMHAQASSPLATPVEIRSLLVALLRTHYSVLRHSLPHTGWLWIVLLVYAPAAAILVTARSSFSKRPSLAVLMLRLLMMVAVLLCLLNAPVSPWGAARNSGYLPTMACLAVAMVAGYLAAFWYVMAVNDYAEAPQTSAERNKNENLPAPIRLHRWTGVCLGSSLLAVVCICPLVNLREADGRQGLFAAAIAEEVVAQLGNHTWIASDSLLDSHLLLAAHAHGHPLHLLPLSTGDNALHVWQLRTWIDTEPVLGGSRERLRQAARLGIQPFLDEWLRETSSAGRNLTVMGTPLIWKKACWQPVPNGLGYSGVKRLEELRGLDLLGPNRAFWTRLETLLAPAAGAPLILDGFRLALRQQAGRTANDLGVLLQDLGRDAESYEAYRTARRFDPQNLSALFNQFFLTKNGLFVPEKDALVQALRVRLGMPLPPLPTIIERYGDIRHADALAHEGHAWSLRGQTAIAKAELDRSLALAPGSTNVQHQLATLYLTQGDPAGSERACRTMLDANPNDPQALVGLATVALICGRADDARQWLAKARSAGASTDSLALYEASMLVQTGQSDDALAKLHAITDQHPDNIEAWSLLADVLFRRNALAEVEQRVLPAMCTAAGKHDHVLIHLVRAQLRSRQQPVDFAGARTSYLRALALRPDLAGVRNALLAMDSQFGNAAIKELDASNVLRADPENAFANYLLATVLLERNELAGAEEHFRHSLGTCRTAEALNDLAETLRRQRRLADAERSVREALAQTPKLFQAWDTLGCILLDAGRADEAAQSAEKAVALCDTDARLHVTLARVRIAQGRPNEARRVLREIPARVKVIPANVKAEIAALEQQLALTVTTQSGLPHSHP